MARGPVRLAPALVALALLAPLGACAPARDDASDGGDPPAADADRPGEDGPSRPDPDPPTTLPDGVALAWTRDELPDAVIEAVADHPAVAAVTVVSVARAGLVTVEDADGATVDELDDGWRLPVEVLGVDPAGYAAVTGLDRAAALGGGDVLLSESSAEVRGVGAGGRLVLGDGARWRVADVAADELVGAAEVLVADGDAPADAAPRYLLARPTDADIDLPAALADVVGDDPEVRLRGVGDTPVLRHADAVTAPARRKASFGEFAVRDAPGRAVEAEPDWVDERITTAQVPVLGEVTCHRAAIEPLQAAMRELSRAGDADLVDPSGYAGCYNPRAQEADGPLSSHAWGIALDLDAQALPQGSEAEPPAPVVEAMADAGFTNGADWLLPDPMHFELVPDRDPG